MNARNRQLQLTVESRQVRDTALCVFHTLLLHRTLGKFHYSTETSYTIGSLGLQEVICEEIDLAYVRVNSPQLSAAVNQEVKLISSAVDNAIQKNNEVIVGSSSDCITSSPPEKIRLYGIDKWSNLLTTQMKLEFYQRRSYHWPISLDCLPWEVWDVNLDVVRIDSSEDFLKMREYVGEQLGDTVLSICELINRAQYTPTIPSRKGLDSVYDNRFTDCAPYLFKIKSDLTASPVEPVAKSSLMMRIIRDSMKFSS